MLDLLHCHGRVLGRECVTESPSVQGHPPLHWAALNNHQHVLQYLLVVCPWPNELLCALSEGLGAGVQMC